MKPKLAILAAACIALSACATIDVSDKPAPDFPHLRVIESWPVTHEVFLHDCGARDPIPLVIVVKGCAVPDFAAGTCHIYYDPPKWITQGVEFYAWDWLRNHELAHCAGYDHPGETEMHDRWTAYKRAHPAAQSAHTAQR